MLILAALVVSVSNAQVNFSPTVIAAGGGVSKFNNIELEWTLGEFSTGTTSIYDKMYTAGYQQPTIAKQLFKDGDIKIGSVHIFPNPVQDFINVDFALIKSETIKMVLSDVNGIILLKRTVSAKINTIKIPVQAIIAGNYYLSLFDTNGNLTNIFKIIKVN